MGGVGGAPGARETPSFAVFPRSLGLGRPAKEGSGPAPVTEKGTTPWHQVPDARGFPRPVSLKNVGGVRPHIFEGFSGPPGPPRPPP